MRCSSDRTAEPPPSEVEFARARRAVEIGLATEAAVEAAILAADRGEPGPAGIVGRLGLTDAQGLALARAEPLAAEVGAALRDPARVLAHFVLVAPLGSGGMGIVHRAWDLKLGRFVALKVLRRPQDERARRLFEREARLAASLSLPNVAAIYEVGDHEGAPFIAMQLVEGRTLAEAGRGGVGARRAAELVRDAARAVEGAHRHGIVHRDLKPANLMLDERGQVFVMDFGLAKPAPDEGGGGGASTLGATGVIAGTPAYMAPEQARGAAGERGAADARTDVYALGACLFELVAGRPPFVSEDRGELIAQVLRDPAPPLGALAPGVPAALEAIAGRCLEKDAARRYQSAAELARDLDRFLAGEPVAAARPRSATRASRKMLGAVVALGAALLAFLAGGPARDARPGPLPLEPALVHRVAAPSQIGALALGPDEIYFACVTGVAGPESISIRAVAKRGGEPRHVAFVPDVPTGIVVDADALYWCDMNSAPPAGGSRIYRRQLRPGDGADPVVLYSGAPVRTTLEDASGLAAHGRLILAVDQVGGSVFRLNGDVPGGEAERLAGPRYAGGFLAEHRNAIAACGGTVYVADEGLASVSRPAVVACPVEGGPFRTLHAGPPFVRPCGIAASFDAVYVADRGANAVFVLPPGGGAPRVVFGGPPLTDLAAIAIDGDALYVADTGDAYDGAGQRLADGPASIYRIDLGR